MQWWRYDPDRLRWMRCDEREARELLAAEQRVGLAGNVKVACIDERFDISQMRDPMLWIGPGVKLIGVAAAAAENPSYELSFGGLPVFLSPYLPNDAIYVVDRACLSVDFMIAGH